MTTLTCENGSMRADANSYASLDYANNYFASDADWSSYSDDEKTAALATAFTSVELLYGPNYMGTILPTSAQVALFPRLPFTDNNGRLIRNYAIPDCLLKAQCEIALMSLQGVDVFPIRSTKRNIAEQSVGLEGLKTSVRYVKPVEDESFKGFRKVDLLLKPILKSGGATYRLGL